MKPKHAIVVGGGIAGLGVARGLVRRDIAVTVVERGTIGCGATWGRSAGWICPAQAGPLPEPAALRYRLRSLVDRTSALYIDPRRLPGMVPWLVRFARACTAERHAAGVRTLAAFGRRAFALVDELAAEGAAFRTYKQGVVSTYGAFLAENWHVDSAELAIAIADLLRRADVTIEQQTDVLELTGRGIRTEAGVLEADAVVLAAGAWSPGLLRMPILAGKGYSFTVRPTVMPSHAVLFVESHVVCSPFSDRTSRRRAAHGQARGRSRRTGCRSSGACPQEATSTSPPATRCSGSRSGSPSATRSPA